MGYIRDYNENKSAVSLIYSADCLLSGYGVSPSVAMMNRGECCVRLQAKSSAAYFCRGLCLH